MKNKFLLILLFVFTFQCGYQVVNPNKLNQYYVESFDLNGDNRINRIIKRDILFYSKSQNKNIYKIKIETKKNKTILEKNIKNEIVKYQIQINSNVEFYNLTTGKLKKIPFSEQGNFSVASKNIDTRNNEKKLIENLVDRLSENIIKEMRSI